VVASCSGKEKDKTVKAINQLVAKLKAWAVAVCTDSKLEPRLQTLANIESQSWTELGSPDRDNDSIDKHLRVVFMAQRTRSQMRVNALLDSFGPQLAALPVMLRTAIETSASKKPGEAALLRRFFESEAETKAAEAGVDMVVAMCSKDEDGHPLNPEIAALHLETRRVEAEISKLRDAGWYRDELNQKRKQLADIIEQRNRRPEAEVQDTQMLVLVPHYLEQRARLAELEESIAKSGDFDVLDKEIAGVMSVDSLPKWRDGSADSLQGLADLISRMVSFSRLTGSAALADEHNRLALIAAALNVHAVAQGSPATGSRFTIAPDGRVVGVWSLPGEVQQVLNRPVSRLSGEPLPEQE